MVSIPAPTQILAIDGATHALTAGRDAPATETRGAIVTGFLAFVDGLDEHS